MNRSFLSMIDHPWAALVGLLVCSVLTTRTVYAQPQQTEPTTPRYASQIDAELRAIGLTPQCQNTSNTATVCRVIAHGLLPGNSQAQRQYMLVLQYDDQTDTIYVYIDHYGQLTNGPDAGTVARRLLELNWQLLAARFEWNSPTGELRISSVINTDSNFDRRAFRSVVRSVLRTAELHADEVSRLSGAPVGVAAPAR